MPDSIGASGTISGRPISSYQPIFSQFQVSNLRRVRLFCSTPVLARAEVHARALPNMPRWLLSVGVSAKNIWGPGAVDSVAAETKGTG